jgi:hypothetical protein
MEKPGSFPSHPDPDRLAKQLIQRAYNRDGLPEIVVGVLFLLVSGLLYAQAVLPKGTLAFRAAVLTFALGLPAAILGSESFLKWLRRRYLIRRSGYVQYAPSEPKHIRRGIAIAVGASALVVIMAIVVGPPGPSLVAVTGVLGGALTALSGRSPRFIAGGAVMALAGLALAYAALPLPLGMAILFGFQGVVVLLSGGLTFARFLVRTSARPGSDE